MNQTDFLPELVMTPALRAAEREMAERQRYQALAAEAWRLYEHFFAAWLLWPEQDDVAERLRRLVERARRRALEREWVADGRPGPTPESQKGGHGR